MGAAAAEVCYIAAGRFEARIEAWIGPWDIAAGAPVSYTHLYEVLFQRTGQGDVRYVVIAVSYIRQFSVQLCPGRGFEGIEPLAFRLYGCAHILERVAVSYTHIDVYKRQPISRRITIKVRS